MQLGDLNKPPIWEPNLCSMVIRGWWLPAHCLHGPRNAAGVTALGSLSGTEAIALACGPRCQSAPWQATAPSWASVSPFVRRNGETGTTGLRQLWRLSRQLPRARLEPAGRLGEVDAGNTQGETKPPRGNARRAEEQASHRDLVPLLTVSRHFHHFRRQAVDPEAWSMTFFVP